VSNKVNPIVLVGIAAAAVVLTGKKKKGSGSGSSPGQLDGLKRMQYMDPGAFPQAQQTSSGEPGVVVFKKVKSNNK